MKNFLRKLYVFIVFAFLYAPIVVLVVLSFNSSKAKVNWGGFTLKWYASLFDSSQIMDAFSTTLLLALLSALISVVLGVLACFGMMHMKKRYRSIVLGITNIPMLNADIVTGIAMMLLLARFMNLGFTSVLIAHITFNIPYVIFCVLPKLNHINHETYEAALDLGASPVYAFWKITLPEIFPGILSGFLMAVTMSLDDFSITYFCKGARVNTLSTMIYAEVRKGIKPEMYALSTLLFVAIMLLIGFFWIGNKKKKGGDLLEDMTMHS